MLVWVAPVLALEEEMRLRQQAYHRVQELKHWGVQAGLAQTHQGV